MRLPKTVGLSGAKKKSILGVLELSEGPAALSGTRRKVEEPLAGG